MPEVSRTRATLRRAEFGFLGVVVYTRVHTPRRCGEPLRAGVATFVVLSCRPLRTSWLMVGSLISVRVVMLSAADRVLPDGPPWMPPRPSDIGRPAVGALPCTPFRALLGSRPGARREGAESRPGPPSCAPR